MRRATFNVLGLVCALAVMFSAGCGPGLVALSGGGVGAFFGIKPADDKKKSTPAVLGPNVAPAVIVTALVREESPAQINYTLIDANADACSVQVEFAVGAGAFASCLAGAGGDGTTGLASSAAGTTHSFSWDFVTDLGPQRTTGLSIRVRANDGAQFGSWFTLAAQSIGNDGPVISNVNVIGPSGVLLITFNLADQNSDLGSLDLEWSTDQAQNFTPVDQGTEVLGNPPVNLLSSPAGSPGQFIWKSDIALSNYVGDFFLRFSTYDQPAGYSGPTPASPVVAGPFTLDNSVNQPPSLALARPYGGFTFTSTVPLEFTLADGESDAAAVIVKYTFDGSTFFDATMSQQFVQGAAGPFPTSPSPTFYSIYWDALADLQDETGFLVPGVDVRLLFIPADSQGGTPTLSESFTVIGNVAPQVNSLTALNTFGNIPVVVNLQDSSADPCSVDIEYSVDGSNFFPLTQSDFTFGSLSALTSSPSGTDNVLIWNSALVLASTNEPAVFLRITPTDHPASAAASPPHVLMDLTGAAFVSGSFPIINNPAGAAPVSIGIYTTSSPATPPSASPASTPQFVTVAASASRTLDRVIQPASATVTDTFWFIEEGPGIYGTLLDGTGAPLVYSTATLQAFAPGIAMDGDEVMVDDLVNGPATFELDDNGSVNAANFAVDIFGATTSDDVAQALVDAINGLGDALFASRVGDVVTLTHRIAAQILQSSAMAPGIGLCQPIATTGSGIAVITDLAGGTSAQIVQYVAPATFPAGSTYVTIKCFIDDPTFAYTVQASYRLYWGSQPTSVTVTPNSPSVLINGQLQLSATVAPGGSPQTVTWEVIGGGPNGTIDNLGLYRAPSSMPGSNQITVRATSVLPSVSGNLQITLLPEPTQVNVTSAGGVTTLALSSGSASTLQFAASVVPAQAPQTVTWRIRHNGVDQGPGNATVGTINASGLYTAPNSLPSPDVVAIEAVSTAKTSLFGQFFLTLQAPAPTSFQVNPSVAVVFAGGAGQQFNTGSFVPSNANQAVTWEVIPSTGFGTVSGSGLYTPPANVAATTNVTVRAKSSINQAVFADAVVTLNPNVASTPTGVTITPSEGLATTQSGLVLLSASVSPGTASQSVTWTVISGSGTVDSSGRYTPNAASDVDYVATVRATSTVSPFPFAEVQISVAGNGKDLKDIGEVHLGRADHSGVWDSTNDRLWWVGGGSEITAPDADLNVLWYSTGSDTIGAGPNLPSALLTTAPKCIMTSIDPGAKKMYAFCNMGGGAPLRVFTLGLAPIGGSWSEISIGGGGDVPVLTTTLRHPLWFDTSNAIFHLVLNNGFVYRFSTGGNWLTKLTISQTAQAPSTPLNNAWSWDQATRIMWFSGPTDTTTSASMRLYQLDMNQNKWFIRTSSGLPSIGIASGTMFFHQGILWLFGGRNVLTNTYTNNLYRIDTTGSPASWSLQGTAGSWPPPRARGSMELVGFGTDPVLFGGGNDSGVFGDMWSFNEAAVTFTRSNPGSLLPQGRSGASAVWAGTSGIAFGGQCDFGLSGELWSFTYQTTPTRLNWSPLDAGGTAPPPMQGAAMLYDPPTNSVFMFGGTSATKIAGKGTGVTNVLYRLSLSSVPATWSVVSPSGTPPAPRFGAALTFSRTGGGLIKSMWMFGGEGTAGTKFSDIWELDLSGGLPGTWINRSVAGGPDAREGSTIGWDSRRNKILVVGGKNGAGTNHQYFEFDVASPAWTSRSSTNTGNQEDVYESGTIYDDPLRRFLTAPATKSKFQALAVVTGSPVNPSWQYLTNPAQSHPAATSGLFDAANGRYYTLFGERTVSGRSVGTNGARIIHFK
ncbi:MAG: hypothetical protein IPP14_08060 [Planctomycetes bacterium]|nr:hypothetical protein [Planctomycetota bacterium]